MSIAANLKREMERNAITTARLAELTGIEKSFLSKYTSGSVKPAQRVVERLAEALGCTVEDLTASNRVRIAKANNVTIAYAAQVLGLQPQTLRVLLQNRVDPFAGFGTAIMGRGRWIYHINRKDFEEYAGVKIPSE